jgi:hypothetical protein
MFENTVADQICSSDEALVMSVDRRDLALSCFDIRLKAAYNSGNIMLFVALKSNLLNSNKHDFSKLTHAIFSTLKGIVQRTKPALQRAKNANPQSTYPG